MSIKIVHDLSQAFGLARSQGTRPTCMAFAMSDLNRFHAQSALLSAEYLYQNAASKTPGWKPGDGTYLKQAIMVTQSPGIPCEEVFPYDLTEPQMPLKALPAVDAGSYFSTTFVNGTNLGASGIATALASGVPVGLVTRLTLGFMQPDEGIVRFSPMVFPGQLHAIVATGVGREEASSELFIRIRNSWGEGWGESGHAWVHEAYVDAHVTNVFRI
jgi:hypothetical protein